MQLVLFIIFEEEYLEAMMFARHDDVVVVETEFVIPIRL
jgi:hypothetical protein